MTIAVDLGRKANKQTNKQTNNLSDAGTMTGLISNNAILIMGIKSHLRYL